MDDSLRTWHRANSSNSRGATEFPRRTNVKFLFCAEPKPSCWWQQENKDNGLQEHSPSSFSLSSIFPFFFVIVFSPSSRGDTTSLVSLDELLHSVPAVIKHFTPSLGVSPPPRISSTLDELETLRALFKMKCYLFFYFVRRFGGSRLT